MALLPQIQRVWQENYEVYGVRKVWRQMRREQFAVARCTVQRLMARLGLRGVIRGKAVRTTVSDLKAPCPLDHVQRQFKAQRSDWTSRGTFTPSRVSLPIQVSGPARHLRRQRPTAARPNPSLKRRPATAATG